MMWGIKRRYLWLALAIGLALVSGVFFYQEAKWKAYGQEFAYGYYISPAKVKTYQLIEGRQAIAIDWETTANPREERAIKAFEPDTLDNPVYSGKRYIARESAKLRYNPENYRERVPSTKEDEYWTVDIYDTEKMAAPPKTIDLLKTVQAGKDRVVRGPVGIHTKDGREYLMISTATFDPQKKFEAIDIKTGKVYPAPFYQGDKGVIFEDGFKSNYASWSQSVSMRSDLESKFLDQNLILSKNSISLKDGKELPQSSNQWLLKKKYPEQFRFFESGAIVYILEDDYVGGDTLLSLFVSDKAELYQGITLSSDQTTDGQERIVNSYEEFLKYYKE